MFSLLRRENGRERGEEGKETEEGRERERERERASERERERKKEKEKLATQQKKLALRGALIKATCNQKSTSGGSFAPG